MSEWSNSKKPKTELAALACDGNGNATGELGNPVLMASESKRGEAQEIDAANLDVISTAGITALDNQKEAKMENISVREQVAAIYAQKRERGLVDVKFLIGNRLEGASEEAVTELLALNNSIENDEHRPLAFGDLRWKA